MHAFCDESGGVASGNPHFTLAVAAMEQETALRAVKAFRRASKLKGPEIKGSSLGPAHRRLFVEVLLKEGCGPGAAVVCARGDAIADWALREWRHRESILYRHLVAEAFGLLGVVAEVRGVTADGGRYKRAELGRVAADLAGDLERLAGRRVPFAYADSAKSPGVQIADVLCNTAGKMLTDGPQRGVAEEALAPLMDRGLLVVRAARLPNLAPAWLKAEGACRP